MAKQIKVIKSQIHFDTLDDLSLEQKWLLQDVDKMRGTLENCEFSIKNKKTDVLTKELINLKQKIDSVISNIESKYI